MFSCFGEPGKLLAQRQKSRNEAGRNVIKKNDIRQSNKEIGDVQRSVGLISWT